MQKGYNTISLMWIRKPNHLIPKDTVNSTKIRMELAKVKEFIRGNNEKGQEPKLLNLIR
jgi:hypothetical protein